jgi:hypothetical protein
MVYGSLASPSREADNGDEAPIKAFVEREKLLNDSFIRHQIRGQ